MQGFELALFKGANGLECLEELFDQPART